MKRSTSANRRALLAFGTPLLSAVSLAAQTPTFSVQLLGNIPGGVRAYVSGINEIGDAVGSAGLGTSTCPYECAVIWHDGTPTLLAVDAVFGSQAVAINNAGQVVGNAFTTNADGAGQTIAVVWNNGTPTLLPGPSPQYTQTTATSINDSADIAGYAFESGDVGYEAIQWTGLTPTVLGTESGCTDGSFATAINVNSTVVGYNACPGQFPSVYDAATVWHGTTATLLGDGVPYAVNNAGLVVGVGTNGAATAWVHGVVTLLQVLPGASNSADSFATAINNRGIIVGSTQVSKETPPGKVTYHALLWGSVNAAPQDLNTLISAASAKEYILTDATGIDDSCTIVVNGFSRKDTVNTIAFMLKPVNPSSCANGMLVQKP